MAEDERGSGVAFAELKEAGNVPAAVQMREERYCLLTAPGRKALDDPIVPDRRSPFWDAAARAKADPIAFRLQDLPDPRGRAPLIAWPTVALALLSAVMLLRFRVNSAWLVLIGAIIGLLLQGRL